MARRHCGRLVMRHPSCWCTPRCCCKGRRSGRGAVQPTRRAVQLVHTSGSLTCPAWAVNPGKSTSRLRMGKPAHVGGIGHAWGRSVSCGAQGKCRSWGSGGSGDTSALQPCKSSRRLCALPLPGHNARRRTRAAPVRTARTCGQRRRGDAGWGRGHCWGDGASQ